MNDLRLAAARKRLTECSGQTDAIEAVREIVSNFLGSEEMAIFDFRSDEARAIWSFGTHSGTCNLLGALSERGRGRIARGECEFDNFDGDGATPAAKTRAFVPIRRENETVGVLAILQLLPQKARFDAADMDLLRLISNEAGEALFPSSPERT